MSSFFQLQNLNQLEHLGKRLSLKLNQKTMSQLKGNYSSKFRGEGLDFDSVRKYQIGDDIRNIDWKVTARTGKTHLKLFNEDRLSEVYFLCDISKYMLFATKGHLKIEQALMALATIGFTAISDKDKFGAIIFSEQQQNELFFKAKNNKTNLLKIIDVALNLSKKINLFEHEKQKNNLTNYLKKIPNILPKHSTVFFATYLAELNEENKKLLQKISYHHNLQLLNIIDPSDYYLENIGNIRFCNDRNSGIFNLNSELQSSYLADFKQRNAEIKNFCNKHNITYQELHTDRSFIKQIREILH